MNKANHTRKARPSMANRFCDSPRRLLLLPAALVISWLLTAPAAQAVPLGCVEGSTASTPCKPAWRLESVSDPTNFAPGDRSGYDEYTITAENIGGASTDGTPITIIEELPQGLRLASSAGRKVEAVDRTLNSEGNSNANEVACSEGTPIECVDSDSTPVPPGQGLTVVVPVEVTTETPGTVTNRDSISGGGALPQQSSEATTISTALPAFGEQSFQNEVTNYEGLPDTQAGSHPFQMTTRIHLTTVLHQEGEIAATGSLKDTRVELPAGLVGTATATPECSDAHLTSTFDNCPADTQVGTLDLIFAGIDAHETEFAIYNMVPPAGMPAQFGIPVFFEPIYIDTSVRTGSDYGVDATVVDAAQLLPFTGISVTLWGTPADPSHDSRRCLHPNSGCTANPARIEARPLLTQATACTGVQTTRNALDSWQEPEDFVGDSFTSQDSSGQPVGVGGCESVPFAPSLSAQPTSTVAESPSGLSVKLHVPQQGLTSPQGLASSALDDAVVTLPAGMSVSPSAAEGLGACAPAQIALEEDTPPTCPESSKLGTVEIVSPLVPEPLKGSIYLAQQDDNPFGSLLALYLSAEGDGVLVKVAGQVTANPVTGQLTASFSENPQIPFTELNLQFNGGSRAPLMTPSACGTYATDGSLTPWSGAAVPVSNSFSIASGCSNGFAPSLSAGTISPQAGSYSPFVLQLERGEGSQRLSSIETTLPPGLLGKVADIPYCTEAQLAAAAAASGTGEQAAPSCPAASELGSANVGAGPGPDPYHVSGRIYLAGPYKGAPLSLAVVTPAVAGPFDLGTVVVRVALYIDKSTAQVHAVSDPLPTILQGIPLDIRSIELDLDRTGFTLNSTSCDQAAVTGAASSTSGAIASLSSRYQAAGCASLRFKPAFSASTKGKVIRRSGAPLTAKIAAPKEGAGSTSSESNLREVKIAIPKLLPARLSTLKLACTAAQFESNPADCPKESDVGMAVAHSPLLQEPLRGPVYLVSHGHAAFPDVEIVLQADERGGLITIVADGKTDIKHGVTTSDFSTLPDAPISSLEVHLPQGPFSLLGAPNGSLCGRTLLMPTRIVGQNGAVEEQDTRIGTAGCRPALRIRSKKTSGASVSLKVQVPAAGTLEASGDGLSSQKKKTSGAGVVPLGLTLTKAQSAKLAHGKTIKAEVELSFKPKRGKRLTDKASVSFKPPKG